MGSPYFRGHPPSPKAMAGQDDPGYRIRPHRRRLQPTKAAKMAAIRNDWNAIQRLRKSIVRGPDGVRPFARQTASPAQEIPCHPVASNRIYCPVPSVCGGLRTDKVAGTAAIRTAGFQPAEV